MIDLLLLIGIVGPLLKRRWHSRKKSKELPLSWSQEFLCQNLFADPRQEETDQLQAMMDEKSFHQKQFVKSLQRCIGLSTIGLEIEFKNLGLELGVANKTILHSISGIAKSGSLLGIMGPSGAGKC